MQIKFGKWGTDLESIQPALSGAFVRLALSLEDRLEELTATTVERLQRELPTSVLGAAIDEEEAADFVRASLGTEVRSLRYRSLPGGCPAVDVHGARVAARVGDLRMLLSGYRIAHMVLWEAWLELVESSDVEEAGRYSLLRYGSRFFFLYAGMLSDYVSERYQAELEQSLRSGEQRRFRAIKALLEGHSPLAAELNLNLEQHHLGLVVWGERGQETARGLAAAMGRPPFSVSPYEQLWWVWISGAQALGPKVEATLRGLTPPPGVGLAAGLETFGESGFRTTHRQAQQARRIARQLSLPVVLYADVAVEALLGENPADARAFVAHELRGIDDASAASQRIRETIAAYFAAEHNAASAAAALGVHQQTVANRLRAAEERMGRPVASRRVELETALRLRVSLGREAP